MRSMKLINLALLVGLGALTPLVGFDLAQINQQRSDVLTHEEKQSLLPLKRDIFTTSFENGAALTVHAVPGSVEPIELRCIVSGGLKLESPQWRGMSLFFTLVAQEAFCSFAKQHFFNGIMPYFDVVAIPDAIIYRISFARDDAHQLTTIMNFFEDWFACEYFLPDVCAEVQQILQKKLLASPEAFEHSSYLVLAQHAQCGAYQQVCTKSIMSPYLLKYQYEILKAAFRSIFKPHKMHFVVVGDIAAIEVEQVVGSTVGKLSKEAQYQSYNEHQQGVQLKERVDSTHLFVVDESPSDQDSIVIDFLKVIPDASIVTCGDLLALLKLDLYLKMLEYALNEKLWEINTEEKRFISVRCIHEKHFKDLRSIIVRVVVEARNIHHVIKSFVPFFKHIVEAGFSHDQFVSAVATYNDMYATEIRGAQVDNIALAELATLRIVRGDAGFGMKFFRAFYELFCDRITLEEMNEIGSLALTGPGTDLAVVIPQQAFTYFIEGKADAGYSALVAKFSYDIAQTYRMALEEGMVA